MARPRLAAARSGLQQLAAARSGSQRLATPLSRLVVATGASPFAQFGRLLLERHTNLEGTTRAAAAPKAGAAAELGLGETRVAQRQLRRAFTFRKLGGVPGHCLVRQVP